MKQEEQQFLNDLDKRLWTAANKLLPMLDAAVYKHVVLGLIFLKYISDAFKERRDELKAAFADPKHDYYLGESELAFYDALVENESVVRELGDDILKKIAHEITEKLRNSTTVDWQKRDSVRARLRNLVRITLRRYKYPTDQQEAAIELVLQQAERLSDAWSAS